MAAVRFLFAAFLVGDAGKRELVGIEFGSSFRDPAALALEKFAQGFRLLLAAFAQ